MKNKMYRGFCSVKVLCVTSLALLCILGAIVAMAFIGIPRIIESQLYKQTQLQEGTDQWDRFVKLPFPLEFKVWFWTVENSDDILKGSKPILKEKGPYVYLQYRYKDILNLNYTEDSVRYKQHITMTFNESLSNGLSDEDEVTIVNPVYMASIQMTSALERLALYGCLDKLFPKDFNKIFITTKVKDLLFDGKFFANASDDVGVACGIVRQKMIDIVQPVRVISQQLDDNGKVQSLKFSAFSFKTDHPDGIYTVNRGIVTPSNLGRIMKWNDDDYLTTWGTSQSVDSGTCNRVRGTDATIYPANSETKYLEIFSTDICRTVKIKYVRDDTYHDLTGLRYEITNETFRPATTNPDNDCFCSKQTHNPDGEEYCFLDGVFDYKPCLGAPAIVSFPHFLYADEKYGNAVDGMAPNETLHKIQLVLEPNTGTPLDGKKRVQLNTVLRPVSFIPTTSNVPRLVFPFLWLEEGVSLPQEYVDLLNRQYFGKLGMANALKYSLIAIFSSAFLISTVFLLRKKFCITNNEKTV